MTSGKQGSFLHLLTGRRTMNFPLEMIKNENCKPSCYGRLKPKMQVEDCKYMYTKTVARQR